MAQPNFASIIVCDDVRREISGKDILVGVYSGDIIVAAMPFFLTLSFWLEYQPETLGKQEFHLRFTYPSGIDVKMRIDLDVLELGGMGIATPQIQLHGRERGEIVVSVSANGNDWKELKRKAVRKGEVNSIFSLNPPSAG